MCFLVPFPLLHIYISCIHLLHFLFPSLFYMHLPYVRIIFFFVSALYFPCAFIILSVFLNSFHTYRLPLHVPLILFVCVCQFVLFFHIHFLLYMRSGNTILDCTFTTTPASSHLMYFDISFLALSYCSFHYLCAFQSNPCEICKQIIFAGFSFSLYFSSTNSFFFLSLPFPFSV